MVADPVYNLNWLFLKRFARLHGLMFPRLVSVNCGLMLTLICCSGLEQYLAYRTGIMAGQFYKELLDKDLDNFKRTAIINILVVLAISVTLSTRVLITKCLTVAWRKSICNYFHKLYLTDFNFYRLNVVDRGLDNPDQRITADVSALVESYSSILNKLIVTPFTVVYYAWDAFMRAGWVGPTGMFLLFLVSTVLNKVLMRPVITATMLKEKREGDFRFKHLMVRSNAESLAFHGDPLVEKAKVDEKLSDVCSTQQQLYFRNFGIDISVNVFSYLGAIASYLVIAIPIFTGAYDDKTGSELSQAVSENAFVCIYLISQLGNLVQITGTVASMAGSTHRVCELREKLELYQLNKNIADDRKKTLLIDIDDSIGDWGDSTGDDYTKIVQDSPTSNSTISIVNSLVTHKSDDSIQKATDFQHIKDDLNNKSDNFMQISADNSQKTADTQPKTADTQPKTADTQPKTADTKPKTADTQPKTADLKHNSNVSLLELRNISLRAPCCTNDVSSSYLIQNLNLDVKFKRNVLIMGPSSSGKSSLLRAIRGIWSPSSGHIKFNRQSCDSVFFLPQKPFFTNGTLREQIFYPSLTLSSLVSQDTDDKTIEYLLGIADLTGLLERCHGLDSEPDWNWYDVLSPGEAQRLAFVRLYVHKPVLAIMDEATSAISQDVEMKLYGECLKMGMTLLSVGHRETLKQFHHQVLTLTGSRGEWILQDLCGPTE